MSIYTQTARFDTGRALTRDELFKLAPSVFATTRFEDSTSEKFASIPTIAVVERLEKEGFSVVGAKQSVTRVPGKAPFTKHLLRIRALDDAAKHVVGGTVAEMLLKNANDGTCAYDLMSALWRIACMNSLVSMLEKIDSLKVRHSGDVMSKVIDGTFTVIENSKLALAAPEAWSQIKMDREESLAFADAARTIRFGDADGNVDSPIQAVQLLTARRTEDADRTNLWTNFNVVQENVIRGGLRGVRIDTETNRRRRMSTRAVQGIDQDVKLNRALWTLASKMAELKGVTTS
jgi:translation initiation factor 1 (eIF-1/SUI1)